MSPSHDWTDMFFAVLLGVVLVFLNIYLMRALHDHDYLFFLAAEIIIAMVAVVWISR